VEMEPPGIPVTKELLATRVIRVSQEMAVREVMRETQVIPGTQATMA